MVLHSTEPEAWIFMQPTKMSGISCFINLCVTIKNILYLQCCVNQIATKRKKPNYSISISGCKITTCEKVKAYARHCIAYLWKLVLYPIHKSVIYVDTSCVIFFKRSSHCHIIEMVPINVSNIGYGWAKPCICVLG